MTHSELKEHLLSILKSNQSPDANREQEHFEAEAYMLEFLEVEGYKDIADIYRQFDFWYS